MLGTPRLHLCFAEERRVTVLTRKVYNQYFNAISFTRPFFDEEEELFAEWGLPMTFKFLNIRVIILAITAILLEKYVVVRVDGVQCNY
jgi:hypothetical protein